MTATAGDGSETIIDATNSTVGVTGTGTTTDPYILTATAGDGSETIIDATNSTVGVTGTGTTADPYILTATAGDGSETIIDATNSTVGVTGTGTTADPYILTATAGDGSETIIDATNSTVGVTGTGTTADPYILTATAGDGSETIIDATNSTVGVTGTGTTADPYILTVIASDGSETIIDATNSTVGVTGTGTTADPYILTATSGDGSETIIDATNSTVSVTGTGTTADPYVLTATGGENLSNTDLTQTENENRTYNLNGNQLYFDGSGNIGIGQFDFANTDPTTPNSAEDKLDVIGQVRARDGFAASPGTANLPSYGFYTNEDNGTGMFRADNRQLGFSTNGTEAVRIDNNQKTIINRDLELERDLLDFSNDSGASGQILSSLGPGNGTDWINPPAGGGRSLSNVQAPLSGNGASAATPLQIDAGANGQVLTSSGGTVSWQEPLEAINATTIGSIIATGKIRADGTIINATPGITVTTSNTGVYNVNLSALNLPDSEYIINATIFNLNISLKSIIVRTQTSVSFQAVIVDNSGPVDSAFFFTLTDIKE